MGLLCGAVVLAGCSGGDDDPSPSGSSATTVAKDRRFPLIAPGGLRPILDRERRRSAKTPPTTVPPTTAATAPPAVPPPPARTTPYFVGQLHETFVDPTRSTPARGGAPASGSRTVQTTIYYPTTLAPSPTLPTPRVATGPFPLIVFAHGYAIDAKAYAPLLEDLTSGGFVVAAPDFPGTSTAYPGGAIRSDSLQQPADISFVITQLLNASATPGLFFGAINPTQSAMPGNPTGE